METETNVARDGFVKLDDKHRALAAAWLWVFPAQPAARDGVDWRRRGILTVLQACRHTSPKLVYSVASVGRFRCSCVFVGGKGYTSRHAWLEATYLSLFSVNISETAALLLVDLCCWCCFAVLRRHDYLRRLALNSVRYGMVWYSTVRYGGQHTYVTCSEVELIDLDAERRVRIKA